MTPWLPLRGNYGPSVPILVAPARFVSTIVPIILCMLNERISEYVEFYMKVMRLIWILELFCWCGDKEKTVREKTNTPADLGCE